MGWSLDLSPPTPALGLPVATSSEPESCSQGLPCHREVVRAPTPRPEWGWCRAAEDQVTCLERVPLRSQPLHSLAGGQLGKAGLMEDARASTMEGFSHLTPPSGLLSPNPGLTPWLWAEGGAGGGGGCLEGSARQQGKGWGLASVRGSFPTWGAVRRPPPPRCSLNKNMPSLRGFHKASVMNDSIERLLRGPWPGLLFGTLSPSL